MVDDGKERDSADDIGKSRMICGSRFTRSSWKWTLPSPRGASGFIQENPGRHHIPDAQRRPWNRLPRELGDNSTIQRTFQRWVELGVLERIWAALVEECGELGA